MADYSTIKGFTVETLAADPYTSSVAAGAWASGTNMNRGHNAGMGAGVSSTACFGCGGYTSPSTTDGVDTETWNGSSWTESGDLNTARYYGAAGGTSTSGICVAGDDSFPGAGPVSSTHNETFDGTSWTTQTSCGSARYNTAGAGADNEAFMIFGGASAPTTYVTNTELWNGSAWTEKNDLNNGRKGNIQSGAGTSTSCILGGGQTTGYLGNTETYDGTSWSEQDDLNTARAYGTMNATDATGALYAGGAPGNQVITEYYDGTTWTEVGDLASGPANGGNTYAKGGSTTAALIGGGPSQSISVTEWSVPSTASIVQPGQVWYNSASKALKGYGALGSLSWSSGGSLNTARQQLGGAGSGNSSALAFAGRNAPTTRSDASET